MKASGRCLGIVCAVLALGVLPVATAMTVESAALQPQQTGLTIWTMNDSVALDAIGSVVAVASAPVVAAGQATEEPNGGNVHGQPGGEAGADTSPGTGSSHIGAGLRGVT